jgi:hypothetical protein
LTIITVRINLDQMESRSKNKGRAFLDWTPRTEGDGNPDSTGENVAGAWPCEELIPSQVIAPASDGIHS